MSNPPLYPQGYNYTSGSPRKWENGADGEYQPDWTVSDDGKGMLTGTMKFFYNCPAGKPVSRAIAAGDSHPKVPALLCNAVNTTIQANDISYVEASFVGLQQDPAGVEWSLNTQTEDVPIEQHPDFGKSDKNWGTVTKEGYDTKTGIPFWNTENVIVTEDGEFGGFRYSESNYKNQLVGVTSYKVPRATVSVSFFTGGSVSEYVSSLAKAGSPPAGVEVPIALKGEAEWFVTAVSVSQYSLTILQVNVELTMSGERGVNELIYGKGDA